MSRRRPSEMRHEPPGAPRRRCGLRRPGRGGARCRAGRAGHTVVAASGVSGDSVRRAEELLPGVPLLPPDEVVGMADLVLLAVPDDALAGMVRGLVATDSLRAGQIVVHTSGAHGVEVLRPACRARRAAAGAAPGDDVHRPVGGPGADRRVLLRRHGRRRRRGRLERGRGTGRGDGRRAGARPAAARPLYHTALAHGANHLVTLGRRDARDLLRAAGVGTPERMLGPLLSAALDNALRHGDRALTGPVARGDAGTVRAHLGCCAEHAPEMVPAYRALARAHRRRAVERRPAARRSRARRVRGYRGGHRDCPVHPRQAAHLRLDLEEMRG